MSIRLPMFRYVFVVLSLAFLILTINGCGSKHNKTAVAPENEVLQSLNHLARSTFGKGQYKQAVLIYQRVLDMAYVRNDLPVILDTRYNLAICLMELERYPEAINLVTQIHEDLLIRDKKTPPDVLLLEATIFYRNDQVDDSWGITGNILSINASLSPLIRAKTYYLRGVISSGKNDIAGIRQSIANYGQPGLVMDVADKTELEGRLAMAENNWNKASIDFDKVTDLRRQNYDYRRMANSLALSAAACEKAGRTEAAAVKYLQAGRSAALKGSKPKSQKWLNQAALLFDKIGKEALAAEAKSFLYGTNDELSKQI